MIYETMVNAGEVNRDSCIFQYFPLNPVKSRHKVVINCSQPKLPYLQIVEICFIFLELKIINGIFNMLVLRYPKRQTIAFSNTLFKLHHRAVNCDDNEVAFDLSESKSLTPFGIMLLAFTINSCFLKNKRCLLHPPKNRKLTRFLKDIGFYEFFKRDPKQLPIINIASGTVQLKKLRGLDPNLIESLTEIFNYHLNISPRVKGSLRMSMLEMITNAIDHSGIDEYFMCAWNYPDRNQLRLCIADLGIGIFESLKQRYPNISNDYEAIIMATNDGVSSRSGRAGLGLTHIKNFIDVNRGQMCIISGNGKVFWKFDQRNATKQTTKQKMALPFDGTIVKLIINIDKEGFYFFADEKEYLF